MLVGNITIKHGKLIKGILCLVLYHGGQSLLIGN